MADELDLAVRIGQELEPVVRDFTATVTASQEVDSWLADLVRSRRYRSQLKILRKAQEATVAAGLPVHAVPVKTLAPLLEAGGLEDDTDEGMIGRWANLLANAATHSADEVPPSFSDILRQLEPIDARMLDALYSSRRHADLQLSSSAAWTARHFEGAMGLDEGAIGQARLDNLARLGLVYQPVQETLGTTEQIMRDRVLFTAFGLAFVSACRPPQEGDKREQS